MYEKMSWVVKNNDQVYSLKFACVDVDQYFTTKKNIWVVDNGHILCVTREN